MPCSGYRDTQQLRIRNESQSVARKVLKQAPHFEPLSLPLSIDLQARHAFFAYYVTSKCWDFLKPYHHPTDSPEHLTLAIEAVSLAFLWHQVYSDAALATARERYISALRMTNKTLRSPREATKDTTLMASLLLDLFEKITDCKPRNNKSWTSHVNGALALVKFRGLEEFQGPSEFNILVRLSTHYIISCVASGSPVPDTLDAVQAYIGNRLNGQDPMLRLSNLMVQYANLRSEVRRGMLSNDEYIELSMELDGNLKALDLELPPYWQYSTIFLDHSSDRTFDLHFDSYSNPRVCQARNILRVIRILLNESLIKHCLASPTCDKYSILTGIARDNIEILAGEICACVPQYVDCDDAARHRLPTSEKSELPNQTPNHNLDLGPGGAGHTHTPNHQLDCYTLIFPIYVAGRSKAVPNVRPWVLKQLHYISGHFYVRNAEVVAQMLERETDVSPWEVYAMLGSYAFAS
ncbi:MAG: hypothetical protein Q9175_007641 [Cornicularia normoerica]